MVFAVVGAMAFTNAARRDNAHQFVTNRLAVEDVWTPVVVEDLTYLDAPAIHCNFRFASQAARDAFWTALLTQLQGVNGPIVGSWVARHDCTHDDPTGPPCVEGERHVF